MGCMQTSDATKRLVSEAISDESKLLIQARIEKLKHDRNQKIEKNNQRRAEKQHQKQKKIIIDLSKSMDNQDPVKLELLKKRKQQKEKLDKLLDRKGIFEKDLNKPANYRLRTLSQTISGLDQQDQTAPVIRNSRALTQFINQSTVVEDLVEVDMDNNNNNQRGRQRVESVGSRALKKINDDIWLENNQKKHYSNIQKQLTADNVYNDQISNTNSRNLTIPKRTQSIISSQLDTNASPNIRSPQRVKINVPVLQNNVKETLPKIFNYASNAPIEKIDSNLNLSHQSDKPSYQQIIQVKQVTSENPYINKYYQIGPESLLSEMHSATVSMNQKHAQIFYHPNNY